MNMEKWDLYDQSGNFVDKQIKRGDKIPVGYFHRVVHIWIINENQEYLIQKRADHLSWFAGRWSTTTGSVQAGQIDYLEEAYRELEEELGLNNTQVDIEYLSDLIIGQSYVSVFRGFLPGYKLENIKLNEEVSDVKWMKKSKIMSLHASEDFVPYSQELFDLVFKTSL